MNRQGYQQARPAIIEPTPLPAGVLFAVLIELEAATGTTGGTDTSSAGYTYRVRKLNGDLIGENIPLSMPRPFGQLIPNLGAGSGFPANTPDGTTPKYGVGFYDRSKNFVLLFAGEVPLTVPDKAAGVPYIKTSRIILASSLTS